MDQASVRARRAAAAHGLPVGAGQVRVRPRAAQGRQLHARLSRRDRPATAARRGSARAVDRRKAQCDDDGKARPCTKAEIAERRAAYEQEARDAEEWRRRSVCQALTTNPIAPSPPSWRNMPAGVRSPTAGKGVFEVDYHFEGPGDAGLSLPRAPGQRPHHSVHRHPPARRRLGPRDRARAYRRRRSDRRAPLAPPRRNR